MWTSGSCRDAMFKRMCGVRAHQEWDGSDCHTLVACNVRQQLLQLGHFHKQPGWEEPELGENQGIKKEGDQAFFGGCEESNLVGN